MEFPRRRVLHLAAGAAAISVLVDERFAGSLDDLVAARAVTTKPLLAKGFFTTNEQLQELRESGADPDQAHVRGATTVERYQQ